MKASWSGLFLIPVLVVLGGQLRAENLLLVTVDTLRADRLSAYGYAANRTPAIDRWASEGVVFERVFAEVPLTLPSHSSILTGTMPMFHGVRDNSGFALADERTTLAEVLRGSGFETAAFVSAYVVASRFGLGQGFASFDDSFPAPSDAMMSTNALRRDGWDTTRRFLHWLNQRKGETPFFAWLHLYDPHTPHRGGYDREVSRVDACVQAIDEALRRLELMDKTHIFFVADHGEGLGEHGEATHGFFIYDSTLRVPWIFRPAAGFQRRVSRVQETFSLIDVMPTALQLLGQQIPSEVQGRSAVRALSGREATPRPLYAESLLPELQFGWSPLRSLRTDRYKLIEAPRPELYDLQEDPGETRNIFDDNQALASRVRQQLEEFGHRYQGEDSASAAAQVDAEAASRLAALGYVAMGSAAAGGGSGADPKDRIAVFEQYQRVLASLYEAAPGDVFASIAAIREVDSSTRGLSYLEGLAWERAGQLPKAAAAFEKAVADEPANVLALGSLARTYLRLQQPEKAEATFRQLLRADPRDYRSRNNLALLLRMRGMEEDAMRELEQVVQEAPAYASGWINLGLGQAQRGQFDAAEETLTKATELEPENAAAFFYLGRVLQAQGKLEAARRALERAAQLDPRIGANQR